MVDANTFTVDGNKVTVKAEIPLKLDPLLHEHINRFAESEKISDVVRFLVKVLDSWDYDGSPGDPSAYQDLDGLEQVLPIGEKVVRVLNARIEEGRNSIIEGDEPNELLIGDRRFVVRKRIPLSLVDNLPGLLFRFGRSGNANDLVKLFTAVADGGDLIDPPTDARAYQNLDLFRVILPLGERVISHLNEKLERARAKN